MAATTEDGKKVDEVVAGEKSNKADEAVVGEKSNTGDEAVGETIKMITLKSSDGESFEITHEAAALSKTIHNMIEEDCVENGVRFPNLNSQILSKVLEYCNKHAASASSDSGAAPSEQEDLKSFDKNFVEVDQATLFDIICAANYLAVEGLLDLTCQKVADIIKGKTVEQIREYFNIENDFTPEEEAEIRKENQWAFE